MLQPINYNYNYHYLPSMFSNKNINKPFSLSSKTKMLSRSTERDNTISEYLWNIFKDTFTGTWGGTSKWYDISNLDKPMLVIPNVVYDISFEECDKAIWKGKGLRFSDTEVIINLKRGDKWDEKFLFPGGFGGQSLLEGLSENIPKQFHELNFFDQKCRSMIISEYTYEKQEKDILGKLSSIQITPFRDEGCNIRIRNQYDTADKLLNSLYGWEGERWSYGPSDKYSYSFEEVKYLFPIGFNGFEYKNKDVCKVWEDNLICGLPIHIKKGERSEFIYGCKVNDNCFKQLKIIRDENNNVSSWTFDIYKKPQK